MYLKLQFSPFIDCDMGELSIPHPFSTQRGNRYCMTVSVQHGHLYELSLGANSSCMELPYLMVIGGQTHEEGV